MRGVYLNASEIKRPFQDELQEFAIPATRLRRKGRPAAGPLSGPIRVHSCPSVALIQGLEEDGVSATDGHGFLQPLQSSPKMWSALPIATATYCLPPTA